MRMRGFFLLFELVVGLLLLSSVWQSSFSYSFSLSPSPLARVCWDVVSIWSAGEGDLSAVERALAPEGKISHSIVPFSPDLSSARVFVCEGERFRDGKWEQLFVRVEE